MAAPILTTYRDSVDHAVDFLGGSPDEKSQRAIRSAIQSAYRDLIQKRSWSYYYAHYRFQLVAPYSTGTIAYTSSTRTVTLTGGTWPTWAIYGHLLIDNIVHRVQERSSSTVLILEPIACPSADISAGETYVLFRSIYTMPADFRTLCRPLTEDGSWYSHYISPEEWNALERRVPTSGTPRSWTVMGDPNLVGSYAMHVYPYPDAAQSYDILYQREARPLVRTGYTTSDTAGTVTITSATATVTGSGTSFDSTMIGSVFRVTSGTTPPDGLDGLNPWTEQKVIVDVDSATSLTVDSNFVNSYSAKKYVISDPVDVPSRMLEAFLRNVEYQLAIKKNMPNIAERNALFMDALRFAFENDTITASPLYRGSADTAPGVEYKYMPPRTND